MSEKTIGFVGGGRIARIMLGGWARAGAMPRHICVADPNPEAVRALTGICSHVVTAAASSVAEQDIVFLAVHPPVMKQAVAELPPGLHKKAIVISLAPRFSIAGLAKLLNGFDRIARVIPNAASLVNRGYNPVAYSSGMSLEDIGVVDNLLSTLGERPEVPEGHLEAYAIVCAMGPTYFWPQIYELASIAEALGLSRDAALDALDSMLWGAMATVKESALTPEQVQDLIPVKPVAEDVATLNAAYRAKLTALMEKLKPELV